MNNTDKIESKPFRRKYLFRIALFLLFVFVVLVIYLLEWKPKSGVLLEEMIRAAVARQLDKEPKELTDEDFAKITQFCLMNQNDDSISRQKNISFYDLKLLGKFTNLEVLDISNIPLPEPHVPRWMTILAKLHAFDLYKKYNKSYMEKYLIDLSPLENLSNLKVVRLFKTGVKSLEPLAKLENIQEIHIYSNQANELDLYAKNSGSISAVININNKKFDVQIGTGDISWYGEYKIDKTKRPFPIIKCYQTGVTMSPLKNVEIQIGNEVDKAMK